MSITVGIWANMHVADCHDVIALDESSKVL